MVAATGGTATPTPANATATGGGQNLSPTALQQIAKQLALQAQPSAQLAAANLKQQEGALSILQAQQGQSAASQEASTALQRQQLGISGQNIGIQEQQLAASKAQAQTQQGYEVQGYNLGQQSLSNQLAQNTAQYGFQQGQFGLQEQSLAAQLGQNTAQYGYQQQQNALTESGLTAQYNLAGQSMQEQQANLAYQTGQQYLGAQSSAVASGSLNTAGYQNTKANIAEQNWFQGAQLANQFASTTQSYNQALQSLGITEQSQQSAYEYGQSQLGLQQKSLGLQEQSAQSAYQYGQSQLGLQQQQAALGQKAELSQYKYSQADIAKQQTTLSNIAKANNISKEQASSQLNSALAQLGLQGTLDTASLAGGIAQSAEGLVSGIEGIFGQIATVSGLGGLLNQ